MANVIGKRVALTVPDSPRYFEWAGRRVTGKIWKENRKTYRVEVEVGPNEYCNVRIEKFAVDWLDEPDALIDYGTINFTPEDAPVRKALEKCNSLGHGHLRTYETAGRCIERITCKICGYTLEIDSSD